MSRLRQYYANRYTSSEATNAEFENIIRYLNGAEIGNRTIFELLDKIFDDAGNVNIGYEFRFNPATGIEYRSDITVNEWTMIAATNDIRGTSGESVGTIEAPLFSNRMDVVATASQTVFPYITSGASSVLMVWINGALMAESSYVVSPTAVTMNTGVSASQVVTIATVRSNPAAAFRRVDHVASSAQVTFPFPHLTTEELAVYRNGILQREGGSYDFIRSPATGTISMTTSQTSGNIITIVCISNSAIRDVGGLMMEDKYATSGLIRLSAINIPDNSIEQAKVFGLENSLAGKAKITVSASAPTGAVTGDLWVNTSYAVPTLMFYDGTRWLNSSPNGMIPLPLAANALQFLRLNSTATSLEFAPFDTTSLVQVSSVGAANGVAPLNSSGQIPTSALPDFAKKSPIVGSIAGTLTNTTYTIALFAGCVHTIDSLTAKLTSGSCTLQLQVAGVNVGSTLACTATTTKLAIASTVIDSSVSTKDVTLIVTGATTPVGLTFNLGNSITG